MFLNLFQPYELCDSWLDQKKSYKPVLKKFESTETYMNMIDDISSRMKLDFKLSNDQLQDIFDICRFEQAWDIDKLSPWCSVSKCNSKMTAKCWTIFYFR